MGKLTRRARAKADYLGFLGAREWPLAASGLGVVLGVVTILPSAVGVVLSVVALALGVATFTRDVRLLRRRWAGFEFTTIAAPFPTAELPPPAAYPEPAYLAVPARGTALVSAAIDRELWTERHTIDVAEEPYRLPPALKATAPHVLPLRARGRLLFNGPIVGMRGDPLPAAGARPAPVRLHRARFFDAVCSNELGALRITRVDTGEEYDLRKAELTDTAGALRELSSSTLADLVGVSTVAFTTDGKLVTVRQSSLNSVSGLLLAPSGSGSLEPRDLRTPDGGRRRLLHTAVRAGMERELCEESGLRPADVRGTKVVGFARWMERGAKPEFFGLTELAVDSAEVTRRRPGSGERLYSAGLTLFDVDLPAIGAALAGGVPLSEALPPRLWEDGSLPLLLALRAAAAWQAARV
ncbi:hypothetical protein [Amycolatopsis vancoresmycina]|uniref:Nudix hydrolase domain-containing protein n=1 Tax=Amycolatopsis vancoresmycina DSM 44592 TaxID=1292037 RepID=R1HLI0_9PSEU|nr:hypothetical protein [Amycolatopsis vancoresmycina]EOD64420.1 hypothetical protein H480_31771 [Amycolatopsis vancoresmycina DSM 44592]